jgi:hypothetical protein
MCSEREESKKLEQESEGERSERQGDRQETKSKYTPTDPLLALE